MILPVFVGMMAYTFGYARRRLNDLNQSGWLSLILLVPLVSFFFGLYMLFSRGTGGSNNYGPMPTENSTSVIAIAWLIPALVILAFIVVVN